MADIEVRDFAQFLQPRELEIGTDHLRQARLKTHASAFEGLLSLIPANKYFEADNSVRSPPLLAIPQLLSAEISSTSTLRRAPS